MMRERSTRIAGFLLLFAGAVVFAAPARAETIRISGTGGPLASIRELAAAFEKTHPRAKVVVFPGLGSTGAIKAVLEGALDIGISARPLKYEEVRQGVVQVRYAVTPFFFATGRNTRADSITLREAVAIYNGTIGAWPDGVPIRLVLRPDLDSHNVILKKMSPAMDEAVKNALARKGMMIATTDQDSADMIEKVPGALGTATLTQLIGEKRTLKPLRLDGRIPTLANVADGSYPYYKTLYMVTGARTSPSARRFVDFVRSPAARKILEGTGNLPADIKPGG